MKGQRARPGFWAVIIAGQRHGSRKIKSFPKSFQGPDGDEMLQLRAPAGGNGDEAPEQAPPEDERFARNPIANISGEHRSAGIDPHEGRPDQSELFLVEMELFLEL